MSSSSSVSDQIHNLLNNDAGQCLPTSELLQQNLTGLIALATAVVLPLIVLEVIALLGLVCWRVEGLRKQGVRGFLWRLGPCLFTKRKKSQVEHIEEERERLAETAAREAATLRYAGNDILAALIQDQESEAAKERLTAAETAQLSPSPAPLTSEALKSALRSPRHRGGRPKKPGRPRPSPREFKTTAGPFARAQDDVLKGRRAARLEMLDVADTVQPSRESMTDADVGAQEAGVDAAAAADTYSMPRTPVNGVSQDVAEQAARPAPVWTVHPPSEDRRSEVADESAIIDSCALAPWKVDP